MVPRRGDRGDGRGSGPGRRAVRPTTFTRVTSSSTSARSGSGQRCWWGRSWTPDAATRSPCSTFRLGNVPRPLKHLRPGRPFDGSIFSLERGGPLPRSPRSPKGVLVVRQVMKFAAAMSVAAVAFAACGSSSNSGGGTGGGAATSGGTSAAGLKVGMAYDVGGRGDQSFNDAAAAGLDKASRTSASSPRRPRPPTVRPSRPARSVCSSSSTPATPTSSRSASPTPSRWAKVAKANPNVKFAIVDDASAGLRGPERRPDHLRRGAGLLPRRRGGGPEVQDQPRRLRRRRQHRPDQEVPGRLRGRRQGGQPEHQDRRQVPHRAAGLLRLQRRSTRARPPPRACTRTAPTSSTTPPVAPAVASSPRPRRRASSRSASTPTRPRRRPRTSATSS